MSPVIKSVLTVILTMIATKWADANTVVQRLLAGDTVPLYGGAISMSFSQIQLWISALVIAGMSAFIGWVHRIQLKRAANIALALPKGATKTDVAQVDKDSTPFSSQPSFPAVRAVANNIGVR